MKAESPEDQVRVQLTIEGWVQGVFFRTSTVQEARRLGVKGWVRNCPDGSVEVVAQGGGKKIDELIQWCHQGPAGAQVRNVQLKWENYLNNLETFETFSIRR